MSNILRRIVQGEERQRNYYFFSALPNLLTNRAGSLGSLLDCVLELSINYMNLNGFYLVKNSFRNGMEGVVVELKYLCRFESNLANMVNTR